MHKSKIYILMTAFAATIAGCASDESLIETAINEKLAGEPLCFELQNKPATMPLRLDASFGGKLDQYLKAAQDAGLVAISEKVRSEKVGFMNFDKPYYEINLTEEGADSHMWDEKEASFCIGNLAVDTIKDWVENQESGRVVQYTVKRTNAPSWAKHKAFDGLYDKEAATVVVKSKKGWTAVSGIMDQSISQMFFKKGENK